MSDKDYTNTAAIWGEKERKTDKHPTHKGSADIRCPCCGETSKFWVSGWARKKDASPKAPEIAMRFEPKEQEADHPQQQELGGREQARAYAAATGGDPDDELPF